MNFVTSLPWADEAVATDVVCLDEFAAGLGIERVDLMKLDVQGKESEALAGAKGLLSRNAIKTIFVELNWENSQSGTCAASRVIDSLSGHGFLFSEPRLPLLSKRAGSWLEHLSDVVAQRSD